MSHLWTVQLRPQIESHGQTHNISGGIPFCLTNPISSEKPGYFLPFNQPSFTASGLPAKEVTDFSASEAVFGCCDEEIAVSLGYF